jgi:hypothetical protein
LPELTKITGGKVTFGLTLCPKQYESKRADVELTFTVGEQDSYDEVFDKASRAVVNRARVLVDLPKLPETAAKPAAKPDPPKTESVFGD